MHSIALPPLSGRERTQRKAALKLLLALEEQGYDTTDEEENQRTDDRRA